MLPKYEVGVTATADEHGQVLFESAEDGVGQGVPDCRPQDGEEMRVAPLTGDVQRSFAR